jgi:hypothetical protein
MRTTAEARLEIDGKLRKIKKGDAGSFEMTSAERKSVRVEISEKTLLRLLAGGQVCAADFQCLDCHSKKCLWRQCLESCTDGLSAEYGSVCPIFCQSCGRCLKKA